MSRVVYEVLPLGDEWMIRLASDSEWETRLVKADAIRRARDLGRRHPEWSVRVLTETGTVESEFTSAEARP